MIEENKRAHSTKMTCKDELQQFLTQFQNSILFEQTPGENIK